MRSTRGVIAPGVSVTTIPMSGPLDNHSRARLRPFQGTAEVRTGESGTRQGPTVPNDNRVGACHNRREPGKIAAKAAAGLACRSLAPRRAAHRRRRPLARPAGGWASGTQAVNTEGVSYVVRDKPVVVPPGAPGCIHVSPASGTRLPYPPREFHLQQTRSALRRLRLGPWELDSLSQGDTTIQLAGTVSLHGPSPPIGIPSRACGARTVCLRSSPGHSGLPRPA